MPSTAVVNNFSLSIIKPHIIRDGQLGQEIYAIMLVEFEISAAEMFYLSHPDIEEFYDV